MENDHIEGFICDLNGEISLRTELIYKLTSRAHKIYLLTRNLGTLINLIGIWMVYQGCSIRIPIGILSSSIFIMWINDYLNYSGRILSEMGFISTLKVMLEEVKTTTKLTQIGDEKLFISSRMLLLADRRHDVSLISQTKSVERGTNMVKKNV